VRRRALSSTWTYANETDLDTMENADSRAHVYNSGTATENWSWNISSQPNNSCSASAVHFLPQAAGARGASAPGMRAIHVAFTALALLVLGVALVTPRGASRP
jgi:hypothetical protein